MKKNNIHPLKPLHSVLFISESNIEEIPSHFVTKELVGQKAVGLTSIPLAWTLPFVVVTGDIFDNYLNTGIKERENLVKRLCSKIVSLSNYLDITDNDNIIVRSSACTEGLNERGKFYSVPGNLSELFKPLNTCLSQLASDTETSKIKIPLIIQKHAVPITTIGHLSNERRCSKEKRDWEGELEKQRMIYPFRLPLRNWTHEIPVEKYLDKTLNCRLSSDLLEKLKIPASWATKQKLRLHFEWVWNGEKIFIVQADQDLENLGKDPTRIYEGITYNNILFKPKCLEIISEEHAQKFNKVKNVFTYQKLGLYTANLYILDNEKLIKDLSNDKIAKGLVDDIKKLVKAPLIIRTDLMSDGYAEKQMLPRTEGISDYIEAIKWLTDIAKKLLKEHKKIAFIFHNFIPASASAFAYAEPKNKIVRIEALWGLPEGLYYYSHDKYIVDTNSVKTENIEKKSIKITKKIHFKKSFVVPNEKNDWIVESLGNPYDWKETINNIDLLKKIGIESRKIADKENKSVSIMWFIDADVGNNRRESFPWYHEAVDPSRFDVKFTQRRKYPLDKTIKIETSKDIIKLQEESSKPRTNIRRVLVHLQEEKLIREKNTLKIIGEICQKIGAVIVLEGGILSHAYYQLTTTNAIVEVVNTFKDYDDKREFNKLIRDKVSKKIEDSGDLVHKAKLSGETFLRVL